MARRVRISAARQDHPEYFEELRRHWPIGKFPCLSTTASRSRDDRIIEYLDAHPGAQSLDSRRRRGSRGSASSTAFSTSTSWTICRRRRPMRCGPRYAVTPFGEERGTNASMSPTTGSRRISAIGLGGRRYVHDRRLRRRAVPILCRLGRGDRRQSPAAQGLSRAAARPSGRCPSGRRGAGPIAPISRSARPTAIKPKPADFRSS